MSIYDLYGTDSSAEIDGVWVPFGGGIKIKLARAGGANKAWAHARELALSPLRRNAVDGSISEEDITEALLEPFCRHIIKAWEGITDKAGKPMPCDQPNKMKLLRDLPDLFDKMLGEAGRIAYYRAIEEEADAGK